MEDAHGLFRIEDVASLVHGLHEAMGIEDGSRANTRRNKRKKKS